VELRTHYVFSFGLLVLLDFILLGKSPIVVIIAGVVSIFTNSVIDILGHEIEGEYIARTPTTHTIPRSIGWGLVTPTPFALVLYIYHLPFELILVTFMDGVVAGLSHMLLDIFTEKGIYHKVNGKWRRIALAHFSYNNPFANGLAFLLGILMLFVSLKL
jgi:hypothetical protein